MNPLPNRFKLKSQKKGGGEEQQTGSEIMKARKIVELQVTQNCYNRCKSCIGRKFQNHHYNKRAEPFEQEDPLGMSAWERSNILDRAANSRSGRQRPRLTKGDHFLIAEQAIELGIKYFLLSGLCGDPFHDTELPQVVAHFKKLRGEGQYLGVYTTGASLGSQYKLQGEWTNTPVYGYEVANALVDGSVDGDYVNIHLSSPPGRPDLFQKIHGGSRTMYYEAMEGIGMLLRMKKERAAPVRIHLNFLLHPKNCRDVNDLKKIVRGFAGWGFHSMRFSIPIQSIGSRARPKNFLTQKQIEEIIQAREYLQSLTTTEVRIPEDRLRVLVQENMFQRCFAKEQNLVIAPDGAVAPCCYTTHESFAHRIRPQLDQRGNIVIDLKKQARQLEELDFNPSEDGCPACAHADYQVNRLAAHTA